MSSTVPCFVPSVGANARIDVLFDELAELTGQRNAIDGRIVDIVAEIEHDGIWGNTGCKSVSALVAWKTGVSPHNADTLVTVARRVQEFPRCMDALREGSLSVDQVGVIAERAGDGSDDHYVDFAVNATVTQLRTAIKLEPTPDPEPRPWEEPKRSIRTTTKGEHTTYTIRLSKLEAAKFDAALGSHQDKVVADWKRDHTNGDGEPAEGSGSDSTDDGQVPPFPTAVDGFMSLVEAGWDADVAARPHGQHTMVVVHVDADARVSELHLGPLLSDEERQYLTCDATCEVWVQRQGRPIGAGRATRTVNRRLRRALEHRDRCCVVPGCGATRGLHAHHLRHWEDGGPTELDNLVLLCPYHHRLHHRGGITLTGPADRLVVTDVNGQRLQPGSLARPPTTDPPAVAPYKGPTGERAQWWWYTPYEPKPPPTPN